MNTEMHKRKIKQVWWPDTEEEKGRNISEEGKTTLMLSATYHGDHDEFWILQLYDGKEVARHNPRYVESIIWK